MPQWADWPWDERVFTNADETILSNALASTENAYANAAGGQSRFPGMSMSTPLAGARRVYVYPFRNQLLAATDAGRLYRIARNGAAEDVTGTPLSGGRRAVFSENEDQVLVAAGGPILTLAGPRTALLSKEAPQSTHVAYVDGYIVAIESFSQRFQYCDVGQPTVWNPLNVFSAEGKPDDLTSVVVTPYRELLLAGPDSIEQFERLTNGNQPFSRRWATGEGVGYPYTLVADKTGTYGVNGRAEFVRFFGQVSQDQSEAVGLTLDKIDDWTDAWAAEMSVKGQKFIVLQMPKATNAYGTEGVTMLLDYGRKRWSFLFGWDATSSRPARWPAWSVARCWGRVFVGVPGGVAVLEEEVFTNLSLPSRFLVRSGHVGKFGPSRIDNVRVRLRRGAGTYGTDQPEPQMLMRVNRDNLGFDQWQWEPLGRPGDREMVIEFGGQGSADTWQFEIAVTDSVPVEFVGMQVQVERLKW